MSWFTEAMDYLFGGQFHRDATGGLNEAGEWISDWIQAPQKAADTIADVTREQIDLQRQALNYGIQQQAIPSAYRNEATVRLAQLYGLEGDPSFIGTNETNKPITEAGYQPPIDAGITLKDKSGQFQPGIDSGITPKFRTAAQQEPQNKFAGIPRDQLSEDQYQQQLQGLYDELSKKMSPDPYLQQQAQPQEQQTRPTLAKMGNIPGMPYFSEEEKQRLKEMAPDYMTPEEQREAWNEYQRNKAEAENRDIVETDEGWQGSIPKDAATPEWGTRVTGGSAEKVGELTSTETEINQPKYEQLNTQYQGPKYSERSQSEMQQQLIDQAMGSPLYNAILGARQAGENAIMRQQSAIGKLRSGSSAHALYDYNTQLQNQALMTTYNQQLQGLNQMAGYSNTGQSIMDQINQIAQTGAMGGIGSAQTLLSGQNAQMNQLLQGIGAIGGIIAAI